MTRRILAGLLALAALLLGGAVLPLGLETAAQYRHDYADAALGQAKALAGVAEERLSDQRPGVSLQRDLHKVVSSDQGVVLLNAAGETVDTAGIPFRLPAPVAVTTTARTWALNTDGETLLLAAVPIGSGGNPLGVVVLARPTESLEGRVHALWLTLAGVAVGSALAAGLLASWLSRWVTRPLRRLEEAAHAVGAGNLEARAGVGAGPSEVRQLAGAFDAMADRLDTLLDGHRAVIADVSHQLRSPMSALRLRLELLPRQGPQYDAQIAGALDELNRLSRLVDGLLAVARADATTQRPTVVDARTVIFERVSAWSPLAAERGVDLGLAPGPEVRAWAVPDHLEQILDTLLGNCFDLDPPPRHVRLSLRNDGDNAIVTVADDGPGMTPSQRKHAFHRFATGHAETGGTGLGLAIAHRLVTTGGGRIKLEETPGGGLTVWLSIPVVAHTLIN